MSKHSLSSRVRITLLKGMEALGTTASNLASNAKLKVNEINLENRRREILTDFSLQAFELWQKGVELPGSLSSMLEELCDIENRLSVLRAQKYAKVPGNDAASETSAVSAEESDGTENAPASVTMETPAASDPTPEPSDETPGNEEPEYIPQTIADDTLANPESAPSEESRA